MPDENDEVDRQPGELRGHADEVRKERQAGVRHEKLCAERIEARVGRPLDRGHINGGVVCPQVIPMDQHGKRR